jgi:hypothetical protein
MRRFWRDFSYEKGMPGLGGAELIGGLIFSSVGFVAFVYGKRMHFWKSMLIGIALMVYPLFVSTDVLLYSLGAMLTAALFVWRD